MSGLAFTINVIHPLGKNVKIGLIGLHKLHLVAATETICGEVARARVPTVQHPHRPLETAIVNSQCAMGKLLGM